MRWKLQCKRQSLAILMPVVQLPVVMSLVILMLLVRLRAVMLAEILMLAAV